MAKLKSDKEIRLARMKRNAGLLLLAMASIFFFSHVMVETRELSHWNILAYARSFAEAAMVGGIADWFAVTALFRRPLHLPIPHTAIIPRKKDQIGDSLGGFVENNFFDPKTLEDKIESFQIAEQVDDWIGKEENMQLISESIAGLIPKLLNSLDDDEVRLFIETRLLNRIEGEDVASALGKILTMLVANRKHEAVFDQLLKIAKKALDENSESIKKKIREDAPWFVPEVMSKKIYEKLVVNLETTFKEAAKDPDHPLRHRFQAAVEAFVNDLKESKETHNKINEIKTDLLGNPAVDAYFANMWQDIKHYILDNLTHHDSSIKKQLEASVYNLSMNLLKDKDLRFRFYSWLKSKIFELAVSHKSSINSLISSTIKKWDRNEISNKLELEVGKDLQYIRVSGTVVGGIVGLAIHAVTHLISAF